VQTAPKLETEEFLSFEDFWQSKGGSTASSHHVEKPKDPRELAAEEAADLVRQARAEADKIRQEAREQGFAEGKIEGEAAGRELYEERLKSFTALMQGLEGQQGQILRQHEGEMLILIKAMVDRLVQHEVSVNPLVIQSCLKNAMEFVVENSTVRIHLNAEDLARIKKASLENPGFFEGSGRIQLVEDPGISVGGCLLRTDFGEIDLTLENCREKLYAAVENAFLSALSVG